MTASLIYRQTEPSTDNGPALIVLLGAPGSGKGTQCARLAEIVGFEHVSTGDALRHEVQSGSAVGRRAARYLRSGQLVPDELVVDVVTNALVRHRDARGVLLDGFPRTESQARTLAELGLGTVRMAAQLVVARAALLHRLRGRGRADDRFMVVRRRLISHEIETRPLLEFYGRRGLLVHVDGNRGAAEVTDALTAHLRDAGIDTGRTVG